MSALRPGFYGIIIVVAGLAICDSQALADETWPPAPPLDVVIAAADAGPLPSSVTAEQMSPEEWRCVFRFQPAKAVERVALVGTFNGWDRHINPLEGPDANGVWTTQLVLSTGVHEYKFLVGEDGWLTDPVNPDRVPDGYGGLNSVVRLGRLALLEQSEGRLSDGQIDMSGLAHRPPRSLYIQPLDAETVSIRYRTLAHDVKTVWLAVKDGEMNEMQVVCEGPLFTYYEGRVTVSAQGNKRSPRVRSFQYTFVLDDGAGQVGDPYTYHYSFVPAGLIEAPQWAKQAVWYQIVLDRFRNGNPANDPNPVRPWTSEWFTPSDWEGKAGQTFYNFFAFDRFYGGDLDGLEEKLPYLKDLGVNAIYLTPIFESPSYHKYDVRNYLHIDDNFGTKGDYEAVAAREDLLDSSTWQWTETDKRFLAFLKKAHEMGFKVILDAVFNHVGNAHPAFLDVQKNGKRSPYADWFDVTTWQPFAYNGWEDFAHMPVFRKSRAGYDSETLKQHIYAITKRWMDPDGDGDPSDGIDGWRLDVPGEISRPFWVHWRRFVKKTNPDALITGEIWHRAEQWLDGQHFDAVMNYEFARIAVDWIFDREQKISASSAAARLTELRLAYPAAITYALQNLVDSHDTDRLVSMALNPDRTYDRQNRVQDNNPDYNNSKPASEAYTRARLAALLQLTYLGAPMIYYGDEAGMWGADDPTNRKPMLWKDLEPYDKPEENAVMDDHLTFYKKAIALRNEHPALQTGSFESLLTDDAADVWVYLRSNDSEHVLVVLNASDSAHEVKIPLPNDMPKKWTTIFGEGNDVTISEGILKVNVPRIGGVVLHASAQ